MVWERHYKDVNNFVDALFAATDVEILVALDAALYELGDQPPPRWQSGQAFPWVNDLNKILAAGGSAWRVRDDGYGLERRVDEAVRLAVGESIASASSVSADASVHLSRCLELRIWRSS